MDKRLLRSRLARQLRSRGCSALTRGTPFHKLIHLPSVLAEGGLRPVIIDYFVTSEFRSSPPSKARALHSVSRLPSALSSPIASTVGDIRCTQQRDTLKKVVSERCYIHRRASGIVPCPSPTAHRPPKFLTLSVPCPFIVGWRGPWPFVSTAIHRELLQPFGP